MLGQAAQPGVERGAVLADSLRGQPPLGELALVGGQGGEREVRGPGPRPEPAHEAPTRVRLGLLGLVALKGEDERLEQLLGAGDDLAPHPLRGLGEFAAAAREVPLPHP